MTKRMKIVNSFFSKCKVNKLETVQIACKDHI